MKMSIPWQQIAERLAESGWSWSHRELDDHRRNIVHFVEVHNQDGIVHCAFANNLYSAFYAVGHSIRAVQ